MSQPRAICAYVSKYQRSRVWRGQFVRGEVFSLGISLNGALADNETIDTITWRVQNPAAIILGAATVDARSASVVCTCGFGGGSVVKVIATSTDGAIFTQLFVIYSASQPFFQGEVAPAMGPYSVIGTP